MNKLLMPEHHLQVAIINGLRYADFVRFSVLKPAAIESNLFLYHLRQLIKAGLVVKTDAGYGLSTSGKSLIAKSSNTNLLFRLQPTMLSVLCVHDPKTDLWLVTERLHQPFMHVSGFPSGKIHEGELFSEAASREVIDKTGLRALQLIQKGVFEVRYWEDDKVTRHIVGIVSVGTAAAETSYLYETPDFKTFWAKDTALFEKNVFPIHDKIISLIKKPGLFIESFDVK